MTLLDSDLSILFAISFHFAENRLDYLNRVVATILAYPVCTSVDIYTNDADNPRLRDLRANRNGSKCRVIPVGDLDHPYDLTWAHKPAIKERFLRSREGFTHFVYLEDDELLSFSSFLYFISSRRSLRAHRLIPGFLRTEWNSAQYRLVSTDNITNIDLSARPYVKCGDTVFIVPDNPYWGGFVLDRELAEEYAESAYFDREKSAHLTPWDIRERAAMGLIFADPPTPFASRYVIPLDQRYSQVLDAATIPHLPNNYANDTHSNHGKIAMSELFKGSLHPENEVK